jgi:hypothetical protein
MTRKLCLEVEITLVKEGSEEGSKIFLAQGTDLTPGCVGGGEEVDLPLLKRI